MDFLVQKDLQLFTLKDPLTMLQWEELIARYASLSNAEVGWIWKYYNLLQAF